MNQLTTPVTRKTSPPVTSRIRTQTVQLTRTTVKQSESTRSSQVNQQAQRQTAAYPRQKIPN